MAAVLAAEASGYLRVTLGDKLTGTDIQALEEWLSARLDVEQQAWKRQVTAATKEIERERKASLDICGSLQAINDELQTFFISASAAASLSITREPSMFHATDVDVRKSQINLLQRNLAALLDLVRTASESRARDAEAEVATKAESMSTAKISKTGSSNPAYAPHVTTTAFTMSRLSSQQTETRESKNVVTVGVQTDAARTAEQGVQVRISTVHAANKDAAPLSQPANSRFERSQTKTTTPPSDEIPAKVIVSGSTSERSIRTPLDRVLIKGKSPIRHQDSTASAPGIVVSSISSMNSTSSSKLDESTVRNHVVSSLEKMDKLRNAANQLPQLEATLISPSAENSPVRHVFTLGADGFLTGRKLAVNGSTSELELSSERYSSRPNKSITVNVKLIQGSASNGQIGYI
jgi:hypothetical protein